jgi:hypothetical protein
MEKIYLILNDVPETNVLLLPGRSLDVKNKLFASYSDIMDMEIEKHSCKLCDKTIHHGALEIVYNDNRYWIYFESDLQNQVRDLQDLKEELDLQNLWCGHLEENFSGMLQCSYCLNFYHRDKCSLSMSDKSYFLALKIRTWACPTCVPEFLPNIHVSRVFELPLHDFLSKLFSLLSKISTVLNLELFMDNLSFYKHMITLAQESFLIDNG